MQLSLFWAQKESLYLLENVQINLLKKITYTHNDSLLLLSSNTSTSEMDFSIVNITSGPILFRASEYFWKDV